MYRASTIAWNTSTRHLLTSKSLVFPPRNGRRGSGAIVCIGASELRSRESRNGLVEAGRLLVEERVSDGVGKVGLAGSVRLRKGLLDNNGEGRRPEKDR